MVSTFNNWIVQYSRHVGLPVKMEYELVYTLISLAQIINSRLPCAGCGVLFGRTVAGYVIAS